MKELFQAIQSASLPGIWAQGVKLARQGAVSLEEKSAAEALFRVRVPGRVVAPLAILYLEDEEWTCDCGSSHDPCEHVIAAVIAQKEALVQGKPLASSAESRAQLGYRLKRSAGPGLIVERVIVEPDGQEAPLTEPLSRLLAAHRCPVEPQHEDLEIDRLLVQSGRGPTRAGTSQGLSVEGYERLLRTLHASKNVQLDGAPIQVSLEPLLPRACARDAKSAKGEAQVEMSVDWPKKKPVILDRGVGQLGTTIHPLGATEIAGPRWERLPLNRFVPADDVGELVSKILPELERHLTVEIQSKKLPQRGGVEKPRIHFDMTPQGHTLSVLPTLVYGDPPQIRIDGGRLVHLQGPIPRRDESTEKKLIQQLREELQLTVGRLVHFDGNEAARFAKRLQQFQSSSQTTFSREVVSKISLVPHLHWSEQSFDLTFSTEEENPRSASVEAVFRAFRDGLDVVPLLDGGWAPLPTDWLSRYGSQVADLLAARRPQGELPIYATPRLAELCQELGEPPPPQLNRLEPLLRDFEGLPPAELPADVSATLRPYQEVGVNWLSFLRSAGLGGVLADDMGLGKTLQTLCAIRGKTLVVCPKSVVFNWASEVKKFRPSLSSHIYHGPGRKLIDCDVTLTTYAVLRLDQEELMQHPWENVILDEAQAIKNPDSQVTRAAFALTDHLPEHCFRLALSGTPLENRLDELWSLFRFTHPGLLGTRSDFDERYSRPISAGDPETGARLRQLIKPFLLRRLKRDVARDLPPRTDVVLTVELEEDQRRVYDAVYAAKRQEVVDALEGGGTVMAALEALLRLRQAACHPALVPGQKGGRSAKVEALVDAVEDAAANDHKCIVFSQWTSLLDLVEPELQERSIGFVRLDGSTQDRASVVEKFQREGGPPVFLSSLKAGGTGLNLTAADHVFLLDPWWNPAAEDQAADRAHRIGQTRPVTVYRLIAKDTIEEGILSLQESKRALAQVALEEGGAAQGITRDDLLALLHLQ